MIGKLVSRFFAAAAVAAGFAGNALAIPVTVDSVEALNPNPNALTMVDAASNAGANGVSLAAFQGLMTGPGGAYQTNRGGVLNFEQQFQGGSWPNAIASNNGIDVGNGPTNLVTARYGAALASSVQFYRLPGTVQEAIDSNTNNVVAGVSATVSGQGGGPDQTAGGVSKYNFTTQMYEPPTSTIGDVGGGYMGVVGSGDLTLEFLTGLRAFGITALPRGSSRNTTLTFTLSDSSTFASSTELVTGSAVFFGAQLTPAQLALGLSIRRVAFAHPQGQNRFDDLAFIPVPEPSSVTMLLVAGVGAAIRRRR